MPEELKKMKVLDLPVHLSDDYTQWLLSRLQNHQGSHVVTLNAEMAIEAEKNTTLANIIRQAELIIPDGAGVVLYLQLKGQRARRCPGIELAESLIEQAAQLGDSCRIVFFGGAPGVAETAAAIWQQKLPGLAIACIQNGYLSPETEPQFIQTLKELQPEIIFVGLGVPRQEYWISQNRHICPHAIWIGVGGSLDIWSGNKLRAPAWLRDNYLEWLYRLYKEPWRWRRMLALPKFALRALFKG